jgi:hypothetical protein
MLTIIAYFISEYYTIKALLLSLRSFEGPYLGENQAQAFYSSLASYNIKANNVDGFILNNTLNNDTYIRQLKADFS